MPDAYPVSVQTLYQTSVSRTSPQQGNPENVESGSSFWDRMVGDRAQLSEEGRRFQISE